MELKCPKCGDNIDSRQGNVQTNLIQCTSCSSIHRLNQLVENHEQKPTRPVYKSNFEHRNELIRFDSNLPQKPLGSKVQVMTTSSSLEVIASTRPFGGADIFVMFFATFWLGFVAIWTFFAAMGAIIMALFSIPFWLVGISMWVGIIKRLTEKQVIEADNYSIRIVKKNLFSTSLEEIPLNEISKIHIKGINSKNPFSNVGSHTTTRSVRTGAKSTQALAPTISSGVKDVPFFENALEAEQDWMMDILRIIVRK